MKRYLSLWLPKWPLTRLRREQRALSGRHVRKPSPTPPTPIQPFALLEAGPHGLRVAVVNKPAQKLGVHPGIPFPDARARVPNIMYQDIDRTADATALVRLADWLTRIAPRVAIDAPDNLIIETTGCAHIYGDENGLIQRVQGLLRKNEVLPFRLGLAGTPAAARAVALEGEQPRVPHGEEAAALKDLPVNALCLSEATTTLLRRFGLTRIGQLYDIDRTALTRRFRSKDTAEAVRLRLDQALGLRRDPINPLRPEPLRTARLPCPDPIETVPAIAMGLNHLASKLCENLSEAGLGAQHFTLHAYLSEGRETSIAINTARPVRAPKHIIRLFEERLERLDPGFGIDLLILVAHRTGDMVPCTDVLSGDLATPKANLTALSTLADRITAKFGEDRVWVTRAAESHIPEKAGKRETFAGDFPCNEFPRLPARPLRLFVVPEPLNVIAEVPEGPPLKFIWRRVARTVTRADGPERINPEWWQYISSLPRSSMPETQKRWLQPKLDPRADAEKITAFLKENTKRDEAPTPIKTLPRTRDYYRVEDKEGHRYWLFRKGLYGDNRGGAPDWYMHGTFA